MAQSETLPSELRDRLLGIPGASQKAAPPSTRPPVLTSFVPPTPPPAKETVRCPTCGRHGVPRSDPERIRALKVWSKVVQAWLERRARSITEVLQMKIRVLKVLAQEEPAVNHEAARQELIDRFDEWNAEERMRILTQTGLDIRRIYPSISEQESLKIAAGLMAWKP